MNQDFGQLVASGDVETRRKVALALADEASPDRVKLLDALLGDNNWRVRKAAVESLLLLPQEEILPVLFPALHDPENAGRRNSALEALAKVGSLALPSIYDHLVEGDVDVKLALLSLLGQTPSRTSIPHLIYYLSHEDKNVVSAAITSLGQIKDPSCLPLLFDVFKRRDDWLWFHLIDAVSSTGGPKASAKLMELYELPKFRKAVLKCFGRMGDPEILPFLLERAAEQGTPLLELMDTLGRIYHSGLPAALVPRHRREVSRLVRQYFPMVLLESIDAAWGDAKVSERRGMILVAGCLADLTLLDHVLSELENPYLHRDAFEAALSYGRIAGDAIVEKLGRSATVDQRVLLVRLLGATGDPKVLPHLLMPNMEEDLQVRMEAISALGEIDDLASLKELVGILMEPDPTFHEVALQSIQNLARKHPSLGAHIQVYGREMVGESDGGVRKGGYTLIAMGLGKDVSHLVPGLADPAPAVRQTVVRLIAQRLGPASFETLLPGLGDQDARVRRTVLSVLGRELLARQPETLMTTLTDPDVWVRAETAYFLAQSTQQDVGQALLVLLDKDALPVRLGALRGLAEVGCGTLFPQVMALATGPESPVEVRQSAMAAVARSGRTDALRLLTEALSSHSPEIQVTAAELMGASHDRRYVPALLRELERSTEPLIKKMVVEALIELKAIEAVPRMLNYLTDPELKDSAYTFFTSLGSENIKLIENEAQSVDFQTKLILTEILKHLESL